MTFEHLSSEVWNTYQALAVKAVTQASEIFGDEGVDRQVEFRTKETPRELVTVLDEKIENHIRTILAPTGLPFLGEESYQKGFDFSHYNGHFWCVDPIDGTTNFIKGLPFFSTSVALVSKQGSEIGFPLGAIYAHRLRELYFTHTRSGAYFNGRPIKRIQDPIEQSLFGICLGSKAYAQQTIDLAMEINSKTLGFMRLGSASIVLSHVVTGKFTGAFGFRVKLWDIAGGLALARSVGCEVWVSNVLDDEYRVSFVVGSPDFFNLVRSQNLDSKVKA